MKLFYFLLIFCIVLITITIVSTIIKFVLILVTRVNYSSRTLFIPAILNIFTWSIVFYFLSFAIYNVLNINISTLLLNTVVLKSNETNNIINILISLACFSIVGIILQSFAYLCINIDYKSIFRNTRWWVKKKVIQNPNGNTNKISITKENEKITFSTAFISSLFSFTLIFLAVFVLFNIGTVLSQKLL